MWRYKVKDLSYDKLKILLIEDDDECAKAVSYYLKKSGIKDALVERATSLNMGIQKSSADKWDVVLLDLGLPDSSSSQTLEKFLQSNNNLPVVVLSSLEDCNVSVEAVCNGAQDYLFKSELNGYILERTIKQAIFRFQILKDLAKSNYDLEQFAYIASHDLRAPLRAISNLATWIEEESYEQLSDDSKENFKLLKTRVSRMNNLLSSLLQYSSIGNKTFKPDSIDTKSVCEEVVAQIGSEESIKLNLAESLPTIMGEKVLFELVIRNLLSNAIKHSNKKVVTVSIGAEREEGKYKFSIKDDGIGIPAEYHARVFELFQSLRPRDEIEGSGMGLAIVKKSIETMGGEVGLISSEGEGATFTFTWPVLMRPQSSQSRVGPERQRDL